MIKKIKKELIDLSEKDYQKFAISLLPSASNVLGVRLPVLRKMAKKISKSDWENFIFQNDDEFFELTMLEGMVIGIIPLEFSKKLALIEQFIKKINNWAICDSFCAGLKEIKNNKEKTKLFLEKYFNTQDEFSLRFCFVILLNYFIDGDFNYVIEKIQNFKSEKYYAKMAAAWCFSVCIVKNYEKSIEIIKTGKIHPFVLKKGIEKAIESLRIKKEQKIALKMLRN